MRIVGAGPGATRILDRSTVSGSWVCLNFQGSVGDPIPLSQDAARHDNTLRLPTDRMTGLTERLLLQSDAPSDPDRPEATIGEFVRVNWIDGVKGSVGVWGAGAPIRQRHLLAGNGLRRRRGHDHQPWTEPSQPAVGRRS